MAQRNTERGVKNIERRLTVVEQILPTLATKAGVGDAISGAVAPLATKAELQAAIAPLATKTELQAAIAPLATKVEVAEVKAELYAAIRAEGIETRRHFDVVAEGMHSEIRMIAEGVVAVQARCDTRHHEVTGTLTRHDRRLTRLEALQSKRR